MNGVIRWGIAGDLQADRIRERNSAVHGTNVVAGYDGDNGLVGGTVTANPAPISS